jgi:hypothetical protein
MCAISLELAPQVAAVGGKVAEITSTNPGTPGIPCPSCQTLNEADWLFCQQCGSKLQPSAGEAPAAIDSVPPEQPTVAIPQTNIQIDALKTVPTKAPSIDVEKSVEVPESRAPQASPPPMPPDLSTVLDQPVEPPRTPEPPVTTPPPSAEQVRSQPLPQQVEGGTTCSQCGRQNPGDSAYCSGCGASIRVAKTIVMASVSAPARGRLHLIMEGGQPGEVYELRDETTVGRTSGDITFPHDGFMSGRHARILKRGSAHVLVDEQSRNGTFIKIKGEVELKPGDMVLIGRQLFRFET